jgi:hypothetical protein
MTNDVMKLRGTKIPHSIKKIPKVTKAKGRSLKTVKLGETLRKLATGFRGKRLRTRRLATTNKKTRMNPRILVAQAKPTIDKSFCSMRGKMMPPREPLVIAMPVALPRLLRKK